MCIVCEDLVMTTDATAPDFFVSYNSKDTEAAVWISWQLESAGYSVVVQEWDFPAGSNFVLEMDKAAGDAKRTLVVLSPNFVTSRFTQPEWASAFAKDPAGELRTIVPVLIAPTAVPGGLLDQIVHINLVGLERDVAAAKLIAGLNPGRSKPKVEPPFPGFGDQLTGNAIAPTTSGSLDWQPLAKPLAALPRDAVLPRGWASSGPAALEITLVPLEVQSLRVSQLENLTTELVASGRSAGLFSQTGAIDAGHTAAVAYARVTVTRTDDAAGLLITREGQRTAWMTLPNDGLGSVVDPQSLVARVARVVQLVVGLDAQLAPRYGFTAAVRPESMVIVGDESVVGRRNSASMRSVGASAFPTPMPDSVRGDAIGRHAEELATEIVARVVAALR